MHVKPKNRQILVKDPRTRIPLTPKGKVIPDNSPDLSYWIRRVTDGDAIDVEAEAKAKAKAEAEAKKLAAAKGSAK